MQEQAEPTEAQAEAHEQGAEVVVDGNVFQRGQAYVEAHLWSREVLPLPLGWLRGLVQLGVVIGEGFGKDHLLMRAHSLTYLTLLSIVPLLGLVATFGDIIGAREQIIGIIEERMAEAVPDAAAYLVGFVEGLDFRQLGAGAAAVLVLTTILAVGNAEQAFNAVWGVQKQRPWVRRIADYLAILVIAPILLGPALALRGAFESQTAVQRILEIPGAEALFDAGIQQLPTFM
nr:YihY/virulence factor BrkB family protein [Myxococcota bacterium]